MSQSKYKIALVGEMLSRGGAEKVQSLLSKYFVAAGIEVHHIIFIDEVTYDFAGTLFTLAQYKTTKNKLFNKWLMLKAFRTYVKAQHFDFIIDFRAKHNYLQEFVIARFVYTTPYTMSIRSSNLRYHFPKRTFLAKQIFKNCYGFVTVSKAVEGNVSKIFANSKVETIYNPVDISEIERLTAEEISTPDSYIFGIGRMKNDVKQFHHLIKAYEGSEARKHHIKLLLMGDGEDKKNLKALVAQKNLEEDVLFHPFAPNPFPYYKKALFTALTSKYEGFPNVLIESLASGTPVVSYDCTSGPNEIIQHGTNGLLVNNQDIDAMKKAINSFVMDAALYEVCKANAKESAERFNPENILKDWLRFLKIEI
ncbi:MAG: glycosyltransferase [Flavobacteriaceae bacterium]